MPALTAVTDVVRPEILSRAELRGLAAADAPGPIHLSAAKNETVAFLLQIDAPADAKLALEPLRAGEAALDAANCRAYQVLPVPVDVNRAGFVRHTGLPAEVRSLPRALLPLAIENGAIALSNLRDPRDPANPSARGAGSGQKLLLWIDVRVPLAAAPGHYVGRIVVQQSQAIATLPWDIDVNDFAIGDDRRLNMVASIDWESLRRYWPKQFEVLRPQLLNRKNAEMKSAVWVLDDLIAIAQDHRLGVYVPRLQPTVKWVTGQPVKIDWTDFDTVVEPWFSGRAFADQTPVGFWPLPKVDLLENWNVPSRLSYYGAAAAHFDQRDWLARAPVTLDNDKPAIANLAQRLQLSAEAGRVLAAHPRVRVMLPLEPGEVQVASDANMVPPNMTGRLRCAAPGLISASPLRQWPKEQEKPETFLRTDLRGLIPYVGAGGDEGDVRTWAWTAYLRGAKFIDWGRCLPSAADLNTPADPNELVWFYPGSWFGVEGAVPTVQLKWLRRAEQDFEYLSLADERGSRVAVLPMARVLAKPVEIQPNQAPDPTYSLFIGTADPGAWPAARDLLTRIITLRGPGIEPDGNKEGVLNVDTLHWIQPLEQPVIVPRTTNWSVGLAPAGASGWWANLKLGIDIYNASDTTPDENAVQYEALPPGWEVAPQPVAVPKLATFQVQRQPMNARVDPARGRPGMQSPVRLQFRNGNDGQITHAQFVAPAAVSLLRTRPLLINGSLDPEEWTTDDALQLGPLVKMMSRPAVQQHMLERAVNPCDIYSCWSDTDLYIAFRAQGLSSPKDVLAARNLVEYQYRRAWSEDVCQVLVQAVYEDNSTGPLVHLSLKPSGNVEAERRGDVKTSVTPWQNLNFQSDKHVRYATTLEKSVWRGELAIPWEALISTEKTAQYAASGRPNIPVMLKFNFSTHLRDSGESASWAGPIDSSRDDSFTGVVMLREP